MIYNPYIVKCSFSWDNLPNDKDYQHIINERSFDYYEEEYESRFTRCSTISRPDYIKIKSNEIFTMDKIRDILQSHFIIKCSNGIITDIPILFLSFFDYVIFDKYHVNVQIKIPFNLIMQKEFHNIKCYEDNIVYELKYISESRYDVKLIERGKVFSKNFVDKFFYNKSPSLVRSFIKLNDNSNVIHGRDLNCGMVQGFIIYANEPLYKIKININGHPFMKYDEYCIKNYCQLINNDRTCIYLPINPNNKDLLCWDINSCANFNSIDNIIFMTNKSVNDLIIYIIIYNIIYYSKGKINFFLIRS